MANHKERRNKIYRYCPICSSKQVSVWDKRKFLKWNKYLECNKCGSVILVKEMMNKE